MVWKNNMQYKRWMEGIVLNRKDLCDEKYRRIGQKNLQNEHDSKL